MNVFLKPCPFCGSANVNLNTEHSYSTGGNDNNYVMCENCGGTTRIFPSAILAVEAWNRRTS